jgi:epoxyqueuosine reductase QueG
MNPVPCVTHILTNPVGGVCQRCAKLCPWNRPDNGRRTLKIGMETSLISTNR